MTSRAADDFDAIGARLRELAPGLPRSLRIEVAIDGLGTFKLERDLGDVFDKKLSEASRNIIAGEMLADVQRFWLETIDGAFAAAGLSRVTCL